MKYILLSADNNPSVYSVPDEVADHLNKYCMDFDKWLNESPHAKKYRIDGGICYNEADFIEYLNEWIFPNQPSILIKTFKAEERISEKYSECEWYNF